MEKIQKVISFREFCTKAKKTLQSIFNYKGENKRDYLINQMQNFCLFIRQNESEYSEIHNDESCECVFDFLFVFNKRLGSRQTPPLNHEILSIIEKLILVFDNFSKGKKEVPIIFYDAYSNLRIY